MMNFFPEYACSYARRLAAASPRFALQISAEGEDAPEAQDPPGKYSPDPFGETSGSTGCFGLRQRFPDRILVMTSGKCFMNCRHCTRRAILQDPEVVTTPQQLADCIRYAASHPLVRDVLLSGGDPLTLSDDNIMRFVDAFAALPQIDIIRVCTRAPCANPARITPQLAKRLAASGKVWLNTQFNCADEVTREARAAAATLVNSGIPVSCQTVLLRGVNDTPDEMLRLLRALSAARIRPYYVFMCDPVAGIERFRVPIEKAREIERICAESIGGLSLPRFVADLPNAKRKLPI